VRDKSKVDWIRKTLSGGSRRIETNLNKRVDGRNKWM
jgi:hypothetical protein